MLSTRISLVSFVTLFFALVCSAAEQLFLSVHGGKSGDVYSGAMGMSTIRGAPAHSASITSFQWGGFSPIDLATGRASGRNQYSPISVTKFMDVGSAIMLNSFASNEVLTSVIITVRNTNTAGAAQNFLTYKLTNAVISSVNNNITATAATETFTFTFQQLVVTAQSGAASRSATIDGQAPVVT